MPSSLRLFRLTAGLLAASAILAAAPPPVPVAAPVAAPAAAANVTIDNFTFSPAALTVAAGTRVTWTNRDDIPHVVADAAGQVAMRSPPLDTGDSFAFTFTRPGAYRYFCALHPMMTGTVIVK